MKGLKFAVAGLAMAVGAHSFAADTVEVVGEKYKVVEFNKNSADLTDTAKKGLADLVQASRKNNAEIEKVHVAAWADQALPVSGKKDLTKSERDLAAKRAEAVETYLEKTYNVDDVAKYNLAERANWLAKAFNTKDAELKSLFTTDKSAPLEHAEFVTIKEHASPSTAVVVVRTEREVKVKK